MRPRLSKSLFVGAYTAVMLVGTLLSGTGMLISGGTGQGDGLPLVVAAGVPGIAALVLLLVLFYRMWSVLPRQFARTTPGKALGFCFIPLFNAYWAFVVLAGWARDFNRYAAAARFSVPRVSESLPVVVASVNVLGVLLGWLGMAGGAPWWLGTAAALPNLVLYPLFIHQVCTAVNALPQEAMFPEVGRGPAPGAGAGAGVAAAPYAAASASRGKGTASLVLGILSILIPYLGLILGIIAIVLARKQMRAHKTGAAVAGLVTGIIGTVLWGLTILLGLGTIFYLTVIE